MAVWMIGILGLYHSPLIRQPSQQVTEMDVYGGEWFLQFKNPAVTLGGMGYFPSVQFVRFGYNAINSNPTLLQSGYHRVPNRLGYDRFINLGQAVGSDQYLITTERFQLASINPILSSQGITVIPFFWPGFRTNDFARLSQDQSVDKLYSNGEFDVWWVSRRYP